jgi:nickel-type superoxide dismutase maturation protease
MILLQVLRVRGGSLAPRYRDGDYVVISGVGMKRIHPGDVVVFDHPEYGRLIKRIEGVEPCGHLRVRGDDIDSVDSRRFGPVPRSSLLGRVVWHVKKG